MALDVSGNWQTGDDLRIITALSLPFGSFTLKCIQDCCGQLEAMSPEAVLEVRTLLDEYEAAKTAESSQNLADSEGKTLVKADVLEWEVDDSSLPSGTYDGSSGVTYTAIEALVTDVLNVAETNFSTFDWWKLDSSSGNQLDVMWTMQSTRNSTTYNHNYAVRYSSASITSTDTYIYPVTDAQIAAGAAATGITGYVQYDGASAWAGHAFNYEVWYSNEHRSLIAFRKTGSEIEPLAIMMEPDHLTQAGPFAGGYFFDHNFINDSPGPLSPGFHNSTSFNVLFTPSAFSVRGQNTIFKNFYALHGETYGSTYTSTWPATSSSYANGVTHMAEVNDMACTYGALRNATCGVVQIPNDSNYYLNIGPGGGGLFLNVGSSAPSFFS